MTESSSLAHASGAEYLWWRTQDGMRTTVALFRSALQAEEVTVLIEAMLYDSRGEVAARWRFELVPERACVIDSAVLGPWTTAKPIDGVLALYVHSDPQPRQSYSNRRLYPFVTWRRPDGRVASLHSDQSSSPGSKQPQRFTEIVLCETPDEANALVILNGETRQPEGALKLHFQNSARATTSARYSPAMEPHTVHRIALAELVPDLVSFSGGEALLLSGTFASLDLETRPYVETTGRRWGIYHAGDVYEWTARPYVHHAFIDGEVNPMAVVHEQGVSTWVNLLHSHDGMEADIPVDVRLFDEDGTCVASRLKWKVARRNGLCRFSVSELLDSPARSFRGHIAIAFAPEMGQAVPYHVQALMEYRADEMLAHVMGWSDEWNSDVRRARRSQPEHAGPIRACFLVWNDAEVESMIAITNAGHKDYREAATAELSLVGPDGPLMSKSICIAPYATAFIGVAEQFPEWNTHATAGSAVLVISSTSDLASLAFTRHRASGAVAAEHFMAVSDWTGSRYTVASGS